jgi:hypothetical protein
MRASSNDARAEKLDAGSSSERTALMNRFRRILVRWTRFVIPDGGEKRADTYIAMLHLSFAIITWRACDALG